jgi:hypothetical protein
MSEPANRLKALVGRLVDPDARRDHMLKCWRASWREQDRVERRRRLSYVTQLCIELEEIKKKTNFSTSLAAMAIEGVIMGDRSDIEGAVEFLTFTGEHAETVARYEPIYRHYVEIAREALLTWPREGVVPS